MPSLLISSLEMLVYSILLQQEVGFNEHELEHRKVKRSLKATAFPATGIQVCNSLKCLEKRLLVTLQSNYALELAK